MYCKTCNIRENTKLTNCIHCGEKMTKESMSLLSIILTILLFIGLYIWGGDSGKSTNIWKDSTRTIQTVERDDNGNVIGVTEEVLQGQEDQDGFFVPEWYHD